jgi:hypothetical protein
VSRLAWSHLGNTEVGSAVANLFEGFPGQNCVAAFDLVEFVFRKFFDIQNSVVAAFRGSQQFVEFDLNGFTVTVLRILNQKYHQKGDDRRGGINDKLPCIAEMKDWTEDRPEHDCAERKAKCHGPANGSGRNSGESLKTSGMFSWFAPSVASRGSFHCLPSLIQCSRLDGLAAQVEMDALVSELNIWGTNFVSVMDFQANWTDYWRGWLSWNRCDAERQADLKSESAAVPGAHSWRQRCW